MNYIRVTNTWSIAKYLGVKVGDILAVVEVLNPLYNVEADITVKTTLGDIIPLWSDEYEVFS